MLGTGRATADLSSQMPYTNAVIFETFRFTSIVPQFPHATIEDTTLLGHEIPARTLVLPLFGAVHHDKDFWGDPEVTSIDYLIDLLFDLSELVCLLTNLLLGFVQRFVSIG